MRRGEAFSRSLVSSPAACFARQRRRAYSQAITQKQIPKKNWQKLTVLGYKCPSFSFPVEIAPCCYTLDIGNKRDHLNVHVSVTNKYIKKTCYKNKWGNQTQKSQILRYFSHFPSTSKKWGCPGYAKFITPFLSVEL